MVDSPGAFAARCLTVDPLADFASFSATRAVTIAMTNQVRASIRSAAPRGTVKGRRGKPVKIGAGYRLHSSRNEGFVSARGPLQLVERDTKRHREPKTLSTNAARRARQRRAGFRARKNLRIPGIGFRRSVKHPGTHGKHPFMNAVRAFEASGKATELYARQMRVVLRKVAR